VQLLPYDTDLKKLYEIDEHLWLERTIKLLKDNHLEEIDRENLIAELEELSRKDKNKAASLLEQIIRHILLLQYWSSEYNRNAPHWEAEIDSFRTQLKRHLTNSLQNYLQEELVTIYQDALRYVSKKTRLEIFPDTCPFELEQLLDLNWLP
jgi:hypothetical protein